MIQMSQLARTAIHKIINEEGGWVYTNHPVDPDKGTYAGIRHQTFLEYMLDEQYARAEEDRQTPLTPAQFKTAAQSGLLKDLIFDIYYLKYYQKMEIEKIQSNMRMPLLSCGVNMGWRRGAMLLQQTINDIGRYTILKQDGEEFIFVKVDGFIGSKTLETLNTVYFRPSFFDINHMDVIEANIKVAIAINAEKFRNNFIKNWVRRYAKIVIADPDDLIFLNGWLNRAFKYWIY